jgi:hypothetical protein
LDDQGDPTGAAVDLQPGPPQKSSAENPNHLSAIVPAFLGQSGNGETLDRLLEQTIIAINILRRQNQLSEILRQAAVAVNAVNLSGPASVEVQCRRNVGIDHGSVRAGIQQEFTG